MFERRLEELEEAFGTAGEQGERLVILDIGANVGSDTKVCVLDIGLRDLVTRRRQSSSSTHADHGCHNDS